MITIENFGPVDKVTVDLNNNFQVFIGAQASGKSTICKVVYFCERIRDYTADFLMDSEQFKNNHQNEYYNNYMKYLTRQFMGCFGTTKHMKRFKIEYMFGENTISIGLNEDGYVRFWESPTLKANIQKLISEAADVYVNKKLDKEVKSIMDNITAIGIMKRQINEMLNQYFENSMEIIYIPAGRSLLATMSEELQDLSDRELDLTMQDFIKLIRSTKSKFGNKIPEMIKNYTKTIKGQINNAAVDNAYEIIKAILKADYTSENDGEKIYFDKGHWVKLMYGSSGQQEALWILMLLFVAILENKKVFIVIEEPEAHLFPIAQKDMVKLIALMINVTGSKAIITTHSPYILTSLNILLYSDKVESNLKSDKKAVIPKNYRVSYEHFAAYKVHASDLYLESLLDVESHMIDTKYIDEVSDLTNTDLEKLIDIEVDE
jgi:predicted ATPase